MDVSKIRKRGWSINSSEVEDGDGNGKDKTVAVCKMSEDSADHSEFLSEQEKAALLNSFPTDVVSSNDDNNHHRSSTTGGVSMNDKPPIIEIHDDSENDDDFLADEAEKTKAGKEESGAQQAAGADDVYVDMFGDENANVTLGTESPARKRRKINSQRSAVNSSTSPTRTVTVECTETSSSSVDSKKRQELELAKKKLSKWAARLFDPDRPRGLIEPPKTIPLNDEFLTAFGKREKKFDETTGRKIDIDRSKLDEDEGIGGMDDEEEGEIVNESKESKKDGSIEGCKVKITNLAYTTRVETLTKACEKYGPLVEVNLIMDKEKTEGPVPLSIGRAYVTFEDPEFALKCIEGMNDKPLDGRLLRLSVAASDSQRRKQTSNQSGGPARYWEKDLSTKCFRCGQVGHMESSCPNEAKPRPCPLCATPGHDIRACPISKYCFNCGVPGHVSRDCSQRRGLGVRMVCGNCFMSQHYRWECAKEPIDVPTYEAKCMVCGHLGHFMCGQMSWCHGLEGIWCFNCGQAGHHGMKCERPLLDACIRDSGLGLQEIDRAEAYSLADELADLQNKRSKGRGRHQHSDRNEDSSRRGRAKSQPPRGDHRPHYRTGNMSDGRSRPSHNENRRDYSVAPTSYGRNSHGGDTPLRSGRSSDSRSPRAYR